MKDLYSYIVKHHSPGLSSFLNHIVSLCSMSIITKALPEGILYYKIYRDFIIM